MSIKMMTVFLSIIFCIFFGAKTTLATSTITGIVYDYQQNPLPDVDVELYGEISYRSHIRTDSTGKYQFDGLGDGRFTIRILPLKYDYDEQSDTVTIFTISGVGGSGGSDFQIKDFYLKPKKGSLVENEVSVVFAQEVPADAKKAYEKALKDFIKKKPDDGFASLNEAIKIFPKYFLALHRLGREYFFRGKYGEAAQFMLRAGDVNNRSGLSFYFLGYSLLKLNYFPAAIVALNQAYTLVPSSSAVLIALGTAERQAGKFTDAENHLLQAKKHSDKDNPEIHRQLALLYVDTKKYAVAVKELEEYLKAKPDDPDAEKLRKVVENLKVKASETSPVKE